MTRVLRPPSSTTASVRRVVAENGSNESVFASASKSLRFLAAHEKARSIGSWFASFDASAPYRTTSSAVKLGCGSAPVRTSWLSVSVPVLSAQRTSMFAASSMALSWVTRTPCLASSMEPIAMLTVNMTGSATGTALMSRTSESGRMSRSLRPSAIDTVRVNATSAPTMTSSHFTTRLMTSSTWSLGCALSTRCVVRPKSVLRPVATTTPVASPPRTVVPDETASSTPLATSRDSPVRTDWSTETAPWRSRRSAGTKSPARTRTTSPVTSCRAGTPCQRPSRRTRAVTCSRARSAATAADARCS